MLSFFSIGMRVVLTECLPPSMPLRALVPLNFLRVQNLAAARPNGTPSVVTTKLECSKSPQTVRVVGRPSFLRPTIILCVLPIGRGSVL